MRRGTLVFLGFVLIVAAILGISQFVRTQPPVDMPIAVSPLAADWINAALERYNATNPILSTQRIRFVAQPIDDLDVWNTTNRIWNIDNHPVAWIPASSASLTYATGLRFNVIQPSLAKTVLVWGAFTSRVDALTDGGVAFDWARIAAAAEQGTWQVINPAALGVNGNLILAFNRPTNTMSGLAVLLSAAAAYEQTPNISGSTLANADFRRWLNPVLQSVPNYNTLGASPANTIAARGTSVGEIALLPENDWLKNLRGSLITAADPIQLIYPAQPFVFDFPLAVWGDSPAPNAGYTADQLRTAITALGVFLASEAEQTAAQSFGLRPTDGTPPTGALFTAGEAYGAQATLELSTPILPPTLNDIQRLITWANQTVR